MPLSSGEKLGPYEIVGPIGAGGMGDVYRGTDTRLHRSVAIKVSAEQFSERSETEARAVAALNHPNICTLYDVGPNYLVMELIDGDTLSDRLRQGPLPLEEALDIARQIADALAAAHERGIVHRDLKPGNIKIRTDGSVKVLDFGLAKVESAEPVTPDSPTVVATTVPGMILGTAAYMAPEQARGKTVDKRADIWAFGVVLWEMLTGRQLFEGETITDVLASVVHRDPDFNRVPQRTRRLLRSCLERDPRKRLQDIGDARLLLDDESAVITAPAVTATPAAPQTVHSVSLVMGSKIAWGVAALLLVVLAPLAWFHFREKPPAAETVRFQTPFPEKVFFKYVSLSPDGHYLAFTGNTPDNVDHLWLRSLDTIEARILPGTDGATSPFWSPDSRFIAFSVGGKLKKMDVLSGAPPLTMCEIPGISGQGTWNSDNMIVFGSRTGNASGLRRVSGSGGTPEMIAAPDPKRKESTLSFPQFMPDGKHFIYLRISSDTALTGIYSASIDTKPGDAVSKRILASNNEGIYVASAKQLLFDRGSTLMAQPFDAARMEVNGDAVPITDSIGTFGAFAWFTASQGGVLAYRVATESQRQLTLLDAKGAPLGHLGDPALYRELAISPDGKKAVAYQQNDQFDLWLFDLARGGRTRFTFTPGFDRYPAWSPDSAQIAYCAGVSNSDIGIYRKAANGATEPELLLKNGKTICPQDWSHDGKYLLFADMGNTDVDLWVLPLIGKPGEAKPAPFLTGRFSKLFARFSPDGRWIAYTSNESGKNEIYVRPFTPNGSSMAGEGKWMISNAGGSQPHWSRDGKKLFYWQETGKLMAVDLDTSGSAVKPGVPAPLFDLPITTTGAVSGVATSVWDMTPDGSQVLANTAAGAAVTIPVTIVLNWPSALKR